MEKFRVPVAQKKAKEKTRWVGIDNETRETLGRIAKASGIKVKRLVKEMIDYALKNMEEAPKKR